MWLNAIQLLFGISAYFWDVWVDVLVGKEQWAMTFPEYKFPGKVRSIYTCSVDSKSVNKQDDINVNNNLLSRICTMNDAKIDLKKKIDRN